MDSKLRSVNAVSRGKIPLIVIATRNMPIISRNSGYRKVVFSIWKQLSIDFVVKIVLKNVLKFTEIYL